MKLPSFSRLVIEDMPKDVRGWIDKLLSPLNSFMLNIRSGLNKNITINDNLSGAIKGFNVSGGSTSLRYTSSRPPKAVMLGSWRDLTDSTWTPSNGIALSWTYDGKSELSVTFYGMHATDNYYVTLLILDD